MSLDTSPMAELVGNLALEPAQLAILDQVYLFVQNFFKDPKFDASHDFEHVLRVTKNALVIFDDEKNNASFDPFIVLLGALLHDVEDKKYSDNSDPEKSIGPIEKLLSSLGLPEGQTLKVRALVNGVSYSSEIKDPDALSQLILKIPELAIVQDADRLDAIGAIGIARCFTFGGAKSVQSLDDSVQHFRDKLLRLEGMMKTATGKRLAEKRSQRIQEFLSWWEDECGQ